MARTRSQLVVEPKMSSSDKSEKIERVKKIRQDKLTIGKEKQPESSTTKPKSKSIKTISEKLSYNKLTNKESNEEEIKQQEIELKQKQEDLKTKEQVLDTKEQDEPEPETKTKLKPKPKSKTVAEKKFPKHIKVTVVKLDNRELEQKVVEAEQKQEELNMKELEDSETEQDEIAIPQVAEEHVANKRGKQTKVNTKSKGSKSKQPLTKKVKQSPTSDEDIKMNGQEPISMPDEVDSTENKPEQDEIQEEEPVSEVIDFTKFKFIKVIDESSLNKSVTLEGTYNGQTIVIKVEKTLINEDDIKKVFSETKTISDRNFVNDIYSSYTLSSISSENSINNLKATVVWPANQSVLAKYTHAEYIIFSETPDHYLKVVEPYIASKLDSESDYNQWVYNILDGKSEVDRVILNDPNKDSGFMLVSDLKWSGNPKELKLLAICHRRDIRSLRDLNDKHLILLKNILTKGTKAIKDKYKKLTGQLRAFIHYHPSFYHFHVHFAVVDPSDYNSTDRDNLLSTVINNITLMGDYYKKSTLTYPLSHFNPLHEALKQAKRL